MRIGNYEAHTIYRLSWEQSSGRKRSRWYTRRASALTKADQMRADGKTCEITEGVVLLGQGEAETEEPKGAAQPKGAATTDLPTVDEVFANIGDEWVMDAEWNLREVAAFGEPEPDEDDDDDSREINDNSSSRRKGKECRATGCSGQICADETTISTCEFKPEYTCYKKAKCEKQADGECGWTETEELKSCIEEAK